jgi:small subunit ribosomal protein S17
VQIEECPPLSKRKAWQVVQRNGAPLAAEAVSA